jgi:hypothetical protein
LLRVSLIAIIPMGGAVAQLGERLLCKEEVRGSSPLSSTFIYKITTFGIICVPCSYLALAGVSSRTCCVVLNPKAHTVIGKGYPRLLRFQC